jgi:hypothetical protein
MDQEQINVWLFTFLDGVHLLDRFDQARKKRFDSSDRGIEECDVAAFPTTVVLAKSNT